MAKGDILVIEDGVVKVGGSSMATTLGLEELEEENKVLRKALELACCGIDCFDCDTFKCKETISCGKCEYERIKEKHLVEYFIKQAEQELEKEQKDE